MKTQLNENKQLEFTVLVPTYNRPIKLTHCLESLVKQSYPAKEILVAIRNDDIKSQLVVDEFKNKISLRIITPKNIGVIAAENALIKEVKTNLIAFIDDDAIAGPDWLKKYLLHFSQNQSLAAVGGHDLIMGDPETHHILVDEVGIITWYGRVIGNHHHQAKGIREVDILKGVNMAVRTSWIELLDTNLQGHESKYGNGSHWELDLCMRIKNKGGKILFDPEILVNHDSDHGHFIKNIVHTNNSHNLVYVMLKNLSPIRKLFFILYILLIGNHQTLGLVKFMIEFFRNPGFDICRKFLFTTKGSMMAILTYVRSF